MAAQRGPARIYHLDHPERFHPPERRQTAPLAVRWAMTFVVIAATIAALVGGLVFALLRG